MADEPGEPADREPRLTEIFLQAAARDGDERATYLDEACAGDPALRVEIESLLRHDLPSTALAKISSGDALTPESIGPYRLLEKLGEGGMGVVYLAEQTTPVRRRVALKLIKVGMDTTQVVARFQAERQALALMDHPNVARVLDAGATDRGRPYFVMELVQGVPITEHCDRHRVTTLERLELFRRVCEGVQHAHQKAILHRDLKPSNVLVAIQGGAAVPKIIDFGVAKATGQRLTEQTLYTELGVVIGTPEYMSPEQADATSRDVDTRTDVYSLGVILYELLTGELPFDPRELRREGLDEIRRRIREMEPIRPSDRLSSRGEAASESARRRRTDPRALVRTLRGELDWIVMKALEKDPARRYPTVDELGGDIRRFLRDEPVLAGPPSGAYRLRKFVRRHRLGVAAVGLVAAALVVGAIATTWQARQAIRARDEADRQSRIAESTSAFLEDALKSATPGRGRGDEATVGDLLESAGRRVDASPPAEPLVEANVRHTLAEVYYARGDSVRAVPQAERALAILLKEKGLENRRTLVALFDYGAVLTGAGRGDEGLARIRTAVEMYLRLHGSGSPEAWDLMNGLAAVLQQSGRVSEARPWAERVLAEQRRALPEGDLAIGYTLNALGLTAESPNEALRYQEEAAAILRSKLGLKHEDTIAAMSTLGACFRDVGRNDDAARVLREALPAARKIFPEGHPVLGDILHHLLWTFDWEQHPDEAERYAEECLSIYRATKPRCDPLTVDALLRLARVYEMRGADAKSAGLIQDARKNLRDCDTAIDRVDRWLADRPPAGR